MMWDLACLHYWSNLKRWQRNTKMFDLFFPCNIPQQQPESFLVFESLNFAPRQCFLVSDNHGNNRRTQNGESRLRTAAGFEKIRKQISIICCSSWMGEMFGDFGWCHFRKSSEKHRKQKRSSEETTNTGGKNMEISGWSTWEDVCKHVVKIHGRTIEQFTQRCVCDVCGERQSNVGKNDKNCSPICFLLSPRFLEKWSNIDEHIFSIGLVQPPARDRFFRDGRKTNMFQSSYHDAMMPCQSQPSDLGCAKILAATSLRPSAMWCPREMFRKFTMIGPPKFH